MTKDQVREFLTDHFGLLPDDEALSQYLDSFQDDYWQGMSLEEVASDYEEWCGSL